MEEINLKELFNYYKKKKLIIILMMLLTALIGYAYIEYLQVPQYNGKTTIILVQKKDGEETEVFDNTENQIEINEKLVTTYSEIIKSRRVLNQVIEQLNLNTTLEKLTKKINVSSISNTSIIEITVKDKSNQMAAEIANEIADIFKKEITQIYNLENVSIIDEAIVEKEPYNVNYPLQISLAVFLGFIIAILMIFIMFYFDNSIKDKREIEEKLNLPVLGEIPSASKLNKKNHKKDQSLNKVKSKKNEKNEQKSQKKDQEIILKKENTLKEENILKEETGLKEKNTLKEKTSSKKETTLKESKIISDEKKPAKKTTTKKTTKSTKEKNTKLKGGESNEGTSRK